MDTYWTISYLSLYKIWKVGVWKKGYVFPRNLGFLLTIRRKNYVFSCSNLKHIGKRFSRYIYIYTYIIIYIYIYIITHYKTPLIYTYFMHKSNVSSNIFCWLIPKLWNITIINVAPVKPLFFEGFSPLSGEEIGVLTVLLRDPRGLEDENRQETFVSFRVLPGRHSPGFRKRWRPKDAWINNIRWMVAKSCTSWKRCFIPWFIEFQPSFWWCRISSTHPMWNNIWLETDIN